MRDMVVRLSSLSLMNIKNVKNGMILMPLAGEWSPKIGGAEILGIYGQNGSGKTAVVDALCSKLCSVFLWTMKSAIILMSTRRRLK